MITVRTVPESYGIRRSDIEGRISAEYYRAEFRELYYQIHERYPGIKRLGSYAEIVCGPFGTEIRSDDYVSSGVPLLRISNITEEGTLDLRDVVFITSEKSAKLATTQVKEGDLVISQRGTLGMPAVVSNEYPIFNISANLIAIRQVGELLPRYLQLYLTSRLGERQIARLQSGQVHKKITTDDVASVLIPNISTQAELIVAMDAARAERRAKLAQADALLADLDFFLLETLSLTSPPSDLRRVFAVRHHSACRRFDPHFHAPEFARIQEMLSHTHCEPLGGVTAYSTETWKPQDHEESTFRYIEIGMVNPKTGEASWKELPTKEAPSRARMMIHTEDIIISLTRPNHGSISHLGKEFEGCIASTGFAVIRDVAPHVRRDYLWCVLRAQICLRQMLQRASGGNYPAVTEQELAKITVPIPDSKVQEAIAVEAHRRREKAAVLRDKAEACWQAAKRWFEEQLIGPAAI